LARISDLSYNGCRWEECDLKTEDSLFTQLACRYDDPAAVSSLPKILRLMINEREAAVLLALPGTEEEISGRCRCEPAFVQATLLKCFRNGLIIKRKAEEGEDRYSFPDIYVDSVLMDRRNNLLGREFQDLWRAWTREKKDQRRIAVDPDSHPGSRIVPIPEMIHDHDTILPFDDARKIVEASQSRVIQQCACRYRTGACDYPVDDICILFDFHAEEAVERGYAENATKEEVLEVLEKASEAGLVHVSSGDYCGDTPLAAGFICNCCPCCCGLLEPYFASGKKLSLGRNYYAKVDPELCIACGICEERCHFDAIAVRADAAVADREQCVGCGLCASGCPSNAIRLHRLREKYTPLKSDRHFINPKDD
jgi:NAD-dependent dihydropyrimidine dehydrogenase PreA subunit